MQKPGDKIGGKYLVQVSGRGIPQMNGETVSSAAQCWLGPRSWYRACNALSELGEGAAAAAAAAAACETATAAKQHETHFGDGDGSRSAGGGVTAGVTAGGAAGRLGGTSVAP